MNECCREARIEMLSDMIDRSLELLVEERVKVEQQKRRIKELNSEIELLQMTKE